MNKIKRYVNKKKKSQPINSSNAGSVFKNNNELLSWEIVDKLGYRGYIYNDAMISNKHANFIINLNDAKYNDVIYIINKIKQDAQDKLNINLETEWVIIE